MTQIEIKKYNGNIIEVSAKGHSGYAENGKDIICASISSIIQTACLGITKYLKIPAKYSVNSKKATLVLSLPKQYYDNSQAQAVLNTMQLGLEDIAFGNEDFINLEVKDEIY